jgi:hypothetical protein
MLPCSGNALLMTRAFGVGLLLLEMPVFVQRRNIWSTEHKISTAELCRTAAECGRWDSLKAPQARKCLLSAYSKCSVNASLYRAAHLLFGVHGIALMTAARPMSLGCG